MDSAVMSEEQITPNEGAAALSALEGSFFGVCKKDY
jgi:hypothetical protein